MVTTLHIGADAQRGSAARMLILVTVQECAIDHQMQGWLGLRQKHLVGGVSVYVHVCMCVRKWRSGGQSSVQNDPAA